MTNSEAGINQQITWVYTQDLDLTAKFYNQVLELRCVRETAEDQVALNGIGRQWQVWSMLLDSRIDAEAEDAGLRRRRIFRRGQFDDFDSRRTFLRDSRCREVGKATPNLGQNFTF